MRRLVPFLVALATLAVIAPATASAACAPDSVSISDIDGDGKYLSPPEITGVTAAVDADCTLTFSDAISNRPNGLRTWNDRLYWWLDTDNNPATGRSGFFAGIDYGLILSSDGVQLYGPSGALLATLPPAGPFSASVPASALGLTDTGTIRILAYSQNAPQGAVFTDPPGYSANYFDYAQTNGAAPFLLRLRPAVAAAPQPIPVAPTPLAPTTPSCVVPAVRGLRESVARARLAAAHCAVIVRHRAARGPVGVALTSTPAAGTTVPSDTKVVVVVRSRPR